MDCSDPRDFLLSFKTLGGFFILFMSFYFLLARIKIKFLRQSGNILLGLAFFVYLSLLTPQGSQFYQNYAHQINDWINAKKSNKELMTKISTDQLQTLQQSFPENWQISFIYFGYTFCPDICPTTLTNVAQFYQDFSKDQKDDPPVTLFITLDPDRDTEQRLNEYTRFFSPHVKSLRLSKGEIEKLTASFGAQFKINKKLFERNYTVDHSADLYLINRNGEIIQRFEHPANPKDLLKTIESLIRK